MHKRGVKVFLTEDLLRAIYKVRDAEGITFNKAISELLDLGNDAYLSKEATNGNVKE